MTVTLPFVPQSLFGRLLAALLTTTGATLVIVAALLVREWGEILTDNTSMEFTAAHIASSVDLLADLPPEEREARVRQRGAVFSFSARNYSRNEFRDPVDEARRLEEQLKRLLGPEYPIEVRQVGERVFIHLPCSLLFPGQHQIRNHRPVIRS